LLFYGLGKRVNACKQIRADTAEYLYVLLQSTDLGFETDEIEEILLDTEWYVSNT